MNQCADCRKAECAPGRSRCYACYGVYRRLKIAPASGMKVLYLDIETSPNSGWFWGDLFNNNFSLDQLIESGRVMCFSAMWQGGKNQFFSEWDWGHDGMVVEAYSLLNEADVVVHYYGTKFDIPHLNTEFLKLGLTPPSPFRQVDLKNAVAKQFKFPSNKLQYVTTVLGMDGKHKTDFDLWKDVMAGKSVARKTMESYNRQDVNLLEELYHRIMPWVPSLPNRNLYDGGTGGCSACGSMNVLSKGTYKTLLSVYPRFVCGNCGYWMRSSQRKSGVTFQQAVL